jgi:hypothetical protein
VAPWAQPQKSQGRRNILLVLLVLLLLLAAIGGGAYAFLHGKSKGSAAGNGTPGTSHTPGTGSTPGGGSTPGNTPVVSGGMQTLDNINRVGI